MRLQAPVVLPTVGSTPTVGDFPGFSSAGSPFASFSPFSNDTIQNGVTTTTTVPEPSSIVLFGIGGIALAGDESESWRRDLSG